MKADKLARYLLRAKKVTSWFTNTGVQTKVFGSDILTQLQVSQIIPGPYFITTKFDWKTLPGFGNPSEKLHGGCIATLIEYSGAIAALVNDPFGRAPQCINSVVDYNAPCGINQSVVVEAKVNGMSKGHSYTEVILREKGSNKLLAKGSQVMVLGEEKLPIEFTHDENISE